MDHTCREENAQERRRLQELVAGLSDEQLSYRLENGWTVAATLAHLAFWDQYRWTMLKKYEQHGVQPDTIDVDTTNEAVLLLAAALPVHSAAQLASAAAETIDRALEQVPPDLAQAIESSGQVRLLRRALHRREHLNQIERAIHA